MKKKERILELKSTIIYLLEQLESADRRLSIFARWNKESLEEISKLKDKLYCLKERNKE